MFTESLSLVFAGFSFHWLLQIPEELQLPGSEPHLMSLRSNQWNRTSGATDICRCSLHGTPGGPVQTAGHQDPALPATVSRTYCGLSLFICLLLLCLGMLNPLSKSALKKEIIHLVSCLRTFWTHLPTAGHRAIICATGKQQGLVQRGTVLDILGVSVLRGLWGPRLPVVQERGLGDQVLLHYASVPLSWRILF